MFTELFKIRAGKRWHGKIKMHGGTKKRATDPCQYPAGVCGDAELGGNADAGHALSTLTSCYLLLPRKKSNCFGKSV